MEEMKKYLNLLGLFISTSLSAQLEYRFNFLIGTLSSLISLIGSIFSLYLFYRTGYTFDGWSWQEAMIVLGIFTLLQGFASAFLIPNLNSIVKQVETGTLDFVLLKPISSQFWLSFRLFSPWELSDILFGLLIIIYAEGQIDLDFTAYILVTIPIIFALIILYSLWFMLGATSIWFVKIYNVTEVFRGFLEAGRYPIIAYPVGYRFFFTFVIPVAFLTTMPAEVMLGRGDMGIIISVAILAMGLLVISKLFWQFALRFYTSASS